MERTPVVVVAGCDAVALDQVATGLLAPGTVVVAHDLMQVGVAVIARSVRTVTEDGDVTIRASTIELDHGCVSCAMREDLLPTLRALHRRRDTRRIVVVLDPLIEPEPLCWAIEHVVVADVPGQIDGPAARDVCIEAVVGVVDAAHWLDDASGDITMAEAGHGGGDDADERTLAQVVVGHVGFADALIVHGRAADGWASAQLDAVLARLAPLAPIGRSADAATLRALLEAVPAGSRRGRSSDAHDPLLEGQPPLERDCGIELVEFYSDRPMHPQRLHDAIDCLLEDVVCARGRLWLATQSDEALWLESAGGGLRVATGGAWLAAMSEAEIGAVDPQRVAMASAGWHPIYGDRHSSVVVLARDGDAHRIQHALRHACLSDHELAAGQDVWTSLPDPFGACHADPCDDLDHTPTPSPTREAGSS